MAGRGTPWCYARAQRLGERGIIEGREGSNFFQIGLISYGKQGNLVTYIDRVRLKNQLENTPSKYFESILSHGQEENTVCKCECEIQHFFEKWEGGSNLFWSLIYSGARKGHKESQNQANRDYFFIAVGNPSNHIDFVNLKHLMLIGNFLVF